MIGEIRISTVAKALSKELREKIVSAYERGAGTIPEVADIFGISERSVARYLQIKREVGDLTPLPLPGRPPILTDTNLVIIKKIILSDKDGTLDKYCHEFYNKTGISVTIVTMHNACEKLNFRRKKRVFTRKSKTGKM
jgi:putative transposase